jgi:hypothetical protein
MVIRSVPRSGSLRRVRAEATPASPVLAASSACRLNAFDLERRQLDPLRRVYRFAFGGGLRLTVDDPLAIGLRVVPRPTRPPYLSHGINL